MGLTKRWCREYVDGTVQCFDDDSFWYTDKGIIIKWAILGGIFLIFMLWFVGGYLHAKQRLRKGLPLLAYHRFLISYQERRRHGQVPQNHFTFYQTQNPYQYPQQPYQQRTDGAYAEPPPLYNGDAPPQYYAPPGAPKPNPNQQQGPPMEMPMYGAPQGPQGPQQNGVVGSSSNAEPPAQLPPRPQQAKAALKGIVDRFRK